MAARDMRDRMVRKEPRDSCEWRASRAEDGPLSCEWRVASCERVGHPNSQLVARHSRAPRNS
jgi:hypothetical protein